MQFEMVLRTFADFFERQRMRYAVIGGLAMQAWGASRLTRDADFAVDLANQKPAIAFAESLGYETLFVSEGYSNHTHSSPDYGRVDLMYVRGETANRLFETATRRPIVGAVELPVARPELLAAMKATAMKNRPHRVLIDAQDVEYLIRLPDIDETAVRDYFDRLGLLELLDAIKKHPRRS